MQKLLLVSFLFCCSTSFAQDVFVNAYTKTDGTLVPSHYRTTPDQTVNNNFTTIGNINPYTGKAGTLPRDSYSIQSLTNSPQVQSTSYHPVSNNNSAYKINITIPLDGGYEVPEIIDQIFENGAWKTVKQEKFNAYLFFDKNSVWFKRGQNKWLGRPQNFVEHNSKKNLYIYNSEYGLTLIDDYLKFIIFYDVNNDSKRYVYIIGKSISSLTKNN